MNGKPSVVLLLVTVSLAAGCASAPPADESPGVVRLQSLPAEQRLAYLREASVWAPIDTASLDLRRGPAGGRFAPGTTLGCDFVMPEGKPAGYTPKFLCRTPDGKTWKIKYGRDNREVYGEVIGSRLLWALGFFSDRIDPVSVECRGCPEDPFDFMKGSHFWEDGELPPKSEVRSFEPAIIESYHGTLMESAPEQGVDWDELLGETSADAARAREQRVHREALSLLAAFLQHADSKPSQQTLSCAARGVRRSASGTETCDAPQIYLGDIGAILGDGWKYKRASTTKIDYALWKQTAVWEDADACVATVHGRPNASLHDVAVSEPARRFLVERLSLLSRDQLREIFAVARVELLGEATADEWADLFLERARQISDARCPETAGAG